MRTGGGGRHRRTHHCARPGCTESSSRSRQSATCGDHIIDHQHLRSPSPGMHPKTRTASPGGTGGTRLRSIRTTAHQQLPTGHTQQQSHSPCHHLGLIEAATAPTRR